MASNTSNSSPDGWTGRRLDMAEFGRRIAARKAELGLPDPPRNAGTNRTPSKRALLKAIEDAGGKW
ncbi:MAG TPA: hypothetical protein VI168_18550 [Croceibacterium sp.]